jgi:SAM-dependent methyltransferase
MNVVNEECRLCGSQGPHQTAMIREMMYGTREQFEYFVCAECDTLQIVDVPDAEELKRHYGADYYSYNVSRKSPVEEWLSTQRDRFQLKTGGVLAGSILATIKPEYVTKTIGQLGIERDARILDVGCGAGHLLDRLYKAGFANVSGVDPFIAEDSSTRMGVPLLKRYLGELTGEFDLIIFSHSLEHVPHPVEMLKTARSKLSRRGYCLVRVPTTSSEAWATYKEDWVQIDAPRHLVIPSRPGLAMAAGAAGLQVEKTIDDSDAFQFMGSERYRQDIPLVDPKGDTLFGRKQIADWERRAAQLNREGRGDQASFVLSAL